MKAEERLLQKAFEKLPSYFHQDADDHTLALQEWFEYLTAEEQAALRTIFDPPADKTSLSARWRRVITSWHFTEKKLKLMFSQLLERN